MKAIEWLNDRVRIIDQALLPLEEKYIELKDYLSVARAIKDMNVRGAPAIGVAAAFGIALGVKDNKTSDYSKFLVEFNKVADTMAATRPTAVNLFKTVDRMKKLAATIEDVPQLKKLLVDEAIKIHMEEIESTLKISRFGSELIKDGFAILTHCNAGPLATAGYGTALGIMIYAHEHGKKISVFADETRPRCQGAKLTVWELQQANVPVKLITDNMAGYLMHSGKVNCVIVGADRIARNGDTANKIGTYSVAVLAKENNIPFYVAAPTSTIDTSIATGDEIIIEERNAEEVTHINGVRIASEGTEVINPAFDVTPHRYITAIITEKGIIRKPYKEGFGI
ncbi:MAG: S-methyl-5-thioribose-1-phosphate isomerase [Dehalococcoidales bacterium]|nr:S-methyl-5-thioribose-1-phosphate isomerase [Dehalococcoidales bacterium]